MRTASGSQMLLLIIARQFSLLFQVPRKQGAAFPTCRIAIILVYEEVKDPAEAFPAVETFIFVTAVSLPVSN